MRTAITVTLLFVLFAVGFVTYKPVANRAWCISTTGNNAWAGDRGAPFQTFAKAISMAAPGDSILYKAGEIYVTSNNYIAPGKDNLFIGAYGTGAAPVLDGGVAIPAGSLADAGSGWKSYTNTGFGNYLNVVSLDGRPQKLARTPGWRKIHGHSNNDYIIDTTLSETGKDYTGWEVTIKLWNWAIGRMKVTSQSGDTLRLQTAPGQKAIPIGHIKNGWGFFLQNGRTDAPSFGDFYYNATTKTLYIYTGSENMSNHVLRAGLYANGFNVSALGITFSGLHFTRFNECAIIKGSPAHGGSLLNSEIDNCGVAGLYMVAMNNWTVSGNDFHDNLSIHFKALENSTNITTGGNNGWTVTNNTFRRSGLYEGMGYGGDPMFSAFYVGGNNTAITDNRVDSCGYNGIHTQGMGLSILRNYVTYTCLLLADGAGIYNFGSRDSIRASNAQSVIKYNTVLYSIGTTAGVGVSTFDPSNDNGKAAGIYLDEHSKNFEVAYNNVGYISWAGQMNNETHSVYTHDNNYFEVWRALHMNDGDANNALQATGNRFVSNTVSLNTYNSAFPSAPQNCFVDFHNLRQRTPGTILFCDSNRYYTFASPASNLFYRQYLAATLQLNFTDWKTYTGWDANTTITQKTDHHFFVNPTAESVGQDWNGWNDAAGTALSGLLEAYSSRIGWNQSEVVVDPPPVEETPAVPKQILLNGVKFVQTRGGRTYRVVKEH